MGTKDSLGSSALDGPTGRALRTYLEVPASTVVRAVQDGPDARVGAVADAVPMITQAMSTWQTPRRPGPDGCSVSPDLPPTTLDVAALGRQLRTRREQLERPQDELALAVGISRVQLQNIESGLSDRAKRTPANPRLSHLGRAVP